MPKETFFNLSEDKQEKVLRAAINEFVNSGYEKGNIGEIAKKAGVAKGSMYQYFENKKELFSYSVRWALEQIEKKYSPLRPAAGERANFFDSFYDSSKLLWLQINEEKEIAMFITDLFLGKYDSIAAEEKEMMLKASTHQMVQMIKEGKENGYFRKDIDEELLLIFLSGASLKYKEYFLKKAENEGEIFSEKQFDKYDAEIRSFFDLLMNGMGDK